MTIDMCNSNNDLNLEEILGITTLAELKTAIGNKGLIQKYECDTGNGEAYYTFIYSGELFFFTINENNKIIIIGNGMKGIINFDQLSKTFLIEGGRLSYNPDNGEIIEDEEGNYIREYEDFFDSYDRKTLKINGAGLIIAGKRKYITGKNGNKIEGITGINTLNNTFEINGEWISYNLNGEAIQDEEGNYIREYEDFFYSYDKETLETNGVGLIIKWERKHITGIDGNKIEGITDINTSDNLFKIKGKWVLYNPDNGEAIEDEKGNYIKEGRDSSYGGNYTGENKDLFYSYDKETLEINGVGLIVEGERRYITLEDGNNIKLITGIRGAYNIFEINGEWISYNSNLVAIQDEKGNYIKECEDSFYSFNKETLKRNGVGLIIEGKRKYITGKDGSEIRGIYEISTGENIIYINGECISYDKNGVVLLDIIEQDGIEFCKVGKKYYYYSEGNLYLVNDSGILANLKKIKLTKICNNLKKQLLKILPNLK